MKKYLKIVFLSSVLTLVSCGDQLERFPIDSLVDATAFQTVTDMENGLRGALGGLNVDNVVQFNTAFTDNGVIGGDSGGQADGILRQILNPDGGDVGLWVDRYNVLNRINRVLLAAESITPEANEQALYNNTVGRLLALRAYIHSELLIYYGFNLQQADALAIVYQNSVTTDAEAERNTTAEVLAFIDEDFTSAKALMTDTDINYPNDDFVDFQRARNALWAGDYGTAITLATSLIGKYPLADAAQYAAMFSEDADTREVIWKYDNVQGNNNNIAGNFKFTATTQDNNFISMSRGLFDLLDPADVRYNVLISPDGNGSDFSEEDYGINKYPPNADTQFINDLKAMRISEMYLLRAEAYARQSQFPNARADVDAIRTIRNSPFTTPTNYATVVQALTDIKLERRIELAFEAHRYLDIKRMRDALNVGIERDPRDCGGATPCNLAVTSERWIFPIPVSELNGNSLISQAPGYNN